MYHYLFTNDLRTSNLEDAMEEVSKLILTDAVPSSKENKSLNNNSTTLGFYFNLKEKGTTAKLAADGNVRRVVLNFIKKFQYPNTRSKESFVDTVNDNIILAPLRAVTKLLLFSKMIDGEDGYLSTEEIVNFVFYNQDVAKKIDIDYFQVYSDIKDKRNGQQISSFANIAQKKDRCWSSEDRQVRDLLSILTWSGFVENDGNNYILVNDEDTSNLIKSEIYDVLLSNEFWDYSHIIKTNTLKNEDLTKEVWKELNDSYENYMQIYDSRYDSSGEIFTETDTVIQTIFFGPPGTGKSYNTTKLIQKYHPQYDKKNMICPYVFRTTIYPEYSYFDFVGTIFPIVKGEDITYDFKPGVFTTALCKALEVMDKNIPVFLIVEEMSRGNIASIFGDIFQLLDRNKEEYSEYKINNDIIANYFNKKKLEEYKSYDTGLDGEELYKKEIYLPPNFNIIGTINTSDQNVFVMDTAFKRRFDFEYVEIDPVMSEDNKRYLNHFVFELGDYIIEWNDFYQKLNSYIVKVLEMPEDKQIGQFFLKFDKKIDEDNYKQLYTKLLQYLWEDIHIINMSEHKLFDSEYKSFSDIYKDFKKHKNVFDINFIEKFEKTKDSSITSESDVLDGENENNEENIDLENTTESTLEKELDIDVSELENGSENENKEF